MPAGFADPRLRGRHNTADKKVSCNTLVKDTTLSHMGIRILGEFQGLLKFKSGWWPRLDPAAD
jgi:hypothetical protein